MTVLDWIITIIEIVGVFAGAIAVMNAMRYDLFARWMQSRRPTAHKFN